MDKHVLIDPLTTGSFLVPSTAVQEENASDIATRFSEQWQCAGIFNVEQFPTVLYESLTVFQYYLRELKKINKNKAPLAAPLWFGTYTLQCNSIAR